VDLLFSQIVVQGGSYLLQLAIAPMVGAENFTPIRIAETWVALAVLPAALGMPTAVIRYTAGGQHSSSSVLTCGLVVVALASHLVAALVFLTVGDLASARAASVVRVLVWTLVLSASTRTILAHLQGLKDFRRSARISAVTAVAGLVLTVALTSMWETGGWLVGRLLSEVMSTACLLLVVRHRIRISRWGYHLPRKLLSLGLFSMLSLLVGRMALQGDMLLLDALVQDQALIANYGMASLARSGMILPVGVVAMLMLPYLVERLTDRMLALGFFLRSVVYALGILVPSCLVVLLLPSSAFTAVFGQDYAHVMGYVRGLLPAIASSGLLTLTNNFLVALERTDLGFGTSLTGLLLNAGLGYWLVPNMGIPGAIVAADVAYVTVLGAQVVLLAALVVRKDPDWPG